MSALTFVLFALAAYRVTRLVVLDDVSLPLRSALAARFPAPGPSLLVRLVNCSWCVGLWVALVGALVLHLVGLCPLWSIVVLAWLAAATVVGFLSRVDG